MLLKGQGCSHSGSLSAELLSYKSSLQAGWPLRRTLWELLGGKFTGKAPRKLGGYFHNDADHRDFTAIGTAAGQSIERGFRGSTCLADAVCMLQSQLELGMHAKASVQQPYHLDLPSMRSGSL